ncbi:DUF397 domain-containing protein [Streptomyces blastmyceticus]|uniref:DUF397 domain-containing protein n=1 Tax=Streptomyces blastmyceticus TaxID=68180 RepID=A0ABP3G8U6_9ACTN
MSTELAWFKSSYSGTEGSVCVEVAALSHAVHIRDSKRKDGPRITIGPHAWETFITYAATTAGA